MFNSRTLSVPAQQLAEMRVEIQSQLPSLGVSERKGSLDAFLESVVASELQCLGGRICGEVASAERIQRSSILFGEKEGVKDQSRTRHHFFHETSTLAALRRSGAIRAGKSTEGSSSCY